MELCTRFREYLLNANQLRHKTKKVSHNSAAGYFSTFRALLKQAYKERLLTENINEFLDYIEWEEVDRDFLTQEELIQLAQTPCKHNILRSASFFSAWRDCESAILRAYSGSTFNLFQQSVCA